MLGGITRSLFGGSKSTQGSNSQSISGFQTLPQFGKDAYRYLVESALGQAQSPDLFRPSAFNPQMTGALDLMSLPTNQADYLSRLSVFTNPFEAAVIDPFRQDLSDLFQGELNAAAQAATQAGAFGGTRQALLESEAQRNLGDTFARTAGALRAGNFADSQNRYRQAIADQLAAGTQQYQLGEAQRTSPLQGLAFLSDILSGSGFSSVGQTPRSTSSSYGKSVSSDGIFSGGGQSGAGNFLSFLSDRRLKKNIVRVGEKIGLNVYAFEYLWSPKKYVGYMAQEVEKLYPSAVGETLGGFKYVNYGALNG